MKSILQSNLSQPRARHDARIRQTAPALPSTDYHFQAAAENLATVEEKRAAGPAELRAFRQIGAEYLDEKNHRGYFVEAAAYAVLAGLSIWSLIPVAMILLQTVYA